MTLTEMHIWWRQFAQQMGMQNVRAILPEQIDLTINTSITDYVNQLVREHIGVTNDRIITDNSKVGQINALRSLYRVEKIPFQLEEKFTGTLGGSDFRPTNTGYFGLDPENRNIGRFINEKIEGYIDEVLDFPKALFIVDFSINYKPGSVGYGFELNPRYIDNSEITNYFPVRLIDDAFLADTLNDFILKPRLRSPIIVTNNNGIYELYIDKFSDSKDENKQGWFLINDLLPYTLRFSYIATPRKVQYLADLGKPNVECDLPEYCHVDILKHAVDLYRIAISNSLHSAQQQGQAAQQEAARNNYRNDGV